MTDRFPDNNLDAAEKLENLPVYSISVAAKLLGISIPTLRMYEREGLIIPFKKDSRQRLYSQGDIKRLMCIREAINNKKMGIAGIKALFSMIPCWSIRHCGAGDRQKCESFNSAGRPCWSFAHNGNSCDGEECRSCEVYSKYADCHNIKKSIIESTRKV